MKASAYDYNNSVIMTNTKTAAEISAAVMMLKVSVNLAHRHRLSYCQCSSLLPCSVQGL